MRDRASRTHRAISERVGQMGVVGAVGTMTVHGSSSQRGYPRRPAAPAAATARFDLPGPDPLRVLLLGDGVAAGVTAVPPEIGLPGDIGLAIAATTARGVTIDVHTDPRMTPSRCREIAGLIDLKRYDAIVLTLGSYDAMRLTSVRSWLDGMAALLDHLETATRGRAPIAIGSIPQLPKPGSSPGRPSARSTARADALNRTLTATPLPLTMTAVKLNGAIGADSSSELPSERQRRWAEQLVRGLGGLDGIPTRPAPEVMRRDERRRQDAFYRSGILQADSQTFDPIVDALQRRLDVPIVSLHFISEDLLWVKSIRGFSNDPVERSLALCNVTIRDHRTVVVPDLTVDPRFSDNPYVTSTDGLRSYVAQPIESPDGERIGCLCAIDGHTREFSASDTTALQQLAYEAQTEIFRLR